MTTKLDYFSAVAKKRPWQAVPVTGGQFVDGAEETIFRALAIRHLELPVKDMLLEGLKRDLPNTPGLIASIESNILDEERHDLALLLSPWPKWLFLSGACSLPFFRSFALMATKDFAP
jgi:hypothetical protein